MQMNKSATLVYSDGEAGRPIRRLCPKRHKLDKCTYTLYSREGGLLSMVTLHVADIRLVLRDSEVAGGSEGVFWPWQVTTTDAREGHCLLRSHVGVDKKGRVSMSLGD